MDIYVVSRMNLYNKHVEITKETGRILSLIKLLKINDILKLQELKFYYK